MSIAMSKANIDPITPEFIQTLLHETGHTLGFVHEHLRPGLVERIDERKAIAYYKTQVGWTEDRTRREVLKRLSPTRAYDISSKPDDVSIMCYPFTQHILKDGSDAIRGGKTLSKYDKKHAAAVYPILKPERREMKEGEVDRITPKDSYFAVKDGIVVEQFEVDQHLGGRIITRRPVPVKLHVFIISSTSEGRLYIVKADSAGANFANRTRREGPDKRSLGAEDSIRWITSTQDYQYCQTHNGRIFKKSVENPLCKNIEEFGSMASMLTTLSNTAGWKRIDIDKLSDTLQIKAGWRRLYQHRKNGEIWVHRGAGDFWTRVYRNRRSKQYHIDAYEDRLFRIDTDGSGSGVWANDDNTEAGWKSLKISKDWSKFSYTRGCVYESVQRGTKEIVTKYAGIC
ncbi:response to abiotic stimulus [Marasmius tenuissimus]|nr:response to abiotic stimulus [Marasmius tenuissimus]